VLRKIADIFGIKTTKQLANELREAYLDDYLRSSFIPDNFPEPLASAVREFTEEQHEHSLMKADDGSEYLLVIPLAIKRLHILKWLESRSYGDKLALKRRQLIYKDEYGDYCFDDWFRESARFAKKHVFTIAFELDRDISEKYKVYAEKLNLSQSLLINKFPTDKFEEDLVVEDLQDSLDECIDIYASASGPEIEELSLDDVDDPYTYESAVSDIFTNLGWNGYATPSSGDQGADVIAEKNGRRLIIQCKLYSSPVGNKAVQEVAAAAGYYEADISAVVTNSTFTKSAKQLAESLGVFLLHHSQIEAFDDLLFDEEDSSS